ncbi:hypothetical protein ACWD0G_14400 [Streptomyces goshikiensis]
MPALLSSQPVAQDGEGRGVGAADGDRSVLLESAAADRYRTAAADRYRTAAADRYRTAATELDPSGD